MKTNGMKPRGKNYWGYSDSMKSSISVYSPTSSGIMLCEGRGKTTNCIGQNIRFNLWNFFFFFLYTYRK
jgi:hypothetical protein